MLHQDLFGGGCIDLGRQTRDERTRAAVAGDDHRTGDDEFGDWWNTLSEAEQESLAASVQLLEERGPNLSFPHSSGINGSKHSHMRELRTQHEGHPYRTLYAFDPRRSAILLIGGDKTGDDRWYDVNVPVADRLYDDHWEQLRKEGLING